MTLRKKLGLKPIDIENSRELMSDLSKIITQHQLKLDSLDNLWIGDVWFGNKNTTDRNIMMTTAQSINDTLSRKYTTVHNWYEGGIDFRKYTRFRVHHFTVHPKFTFLSNADGYKYLKQLYGWYTDKQYI